MSTSGNLIDYDSYFPGSADGGSYSEFVRRDGRLLFALGELRGRRDSVDVAAFCLRALMRGLLANCGGDLEYVRLESERRLDALCGGWITATVFCAAVDAVRCEVSYVAAGCGAALLIRPRSRAVMRLDTGASGRSDIEPGDVITAASGCYLGSNFEFAALNAIARHPHDDAAHLSARIARIAKEFAPAHRSPKIAVIRQIADSRNARTAPGLCSSVNSVGPNYE